VRIESRGGVSVSSSHPANDTAQAR